MEVTVAGETISRKEFEESSGWRTVGSRKLLIEQPPVTGAESQRGNNSKKQCERRLRQIERSSRMPQLRRGDYKIIIRPKGGLRVAEHGAARLATRIYHAAKIPREAQDEDTICPNFQQNITVVSTPTEAHADKYQKIASIKIGNQTFETNAYEAAPDCTSKGVIRGIPLEDTARDITANWERMQHQEEEDYSTPMLTNNNLEHRDPLPAEQPGRRGRSRSRNRSGARSRSRSRTRSRSRSRSRNHTPGPAGPPKVSWTGAVTRARSGSQEAASQGKWKKLEAEVAQLKHMLTQCNQKMLALGEENRTLKEELGRYKQTQQVTPIPPPPIAVTPTEEMEEGATPPPPKRRAEEQVNENKPMRVTTETKVLIEIQQSIKALNEWMNNSSRAISTLTERVESIAKITQQQNECLQQRLLAVEPLTPRPPPNGLEPMASAQQPTSSPYSVIQPTTFLPPTPHHS
ncbi:hypothetical protein HPB50_018396 [Hyalomma asiaticum]|uniref:Uncharacterized protein n=1 Tax=Hyalomma asiaticum TaxID=266040 RepID=A0ACB7S7R1_HYAAI|nr:hypothetical protein HPB50_018396 [Hyalomma asiaticum]